MTNALRLLIMWTAVAVAMLLPVGPAAFAASAIDRLSDQISELVQQGRNAEGLAVAQKLEGLVRRQQGTNGPGYAAVMHNQGMFLFNLGRYREAAEKLNAALAIKLGSNTPESAMGTSAMLVAALRSLSRIDEATGVAQRALALGTQAYGANDPRLAATVASLGALAVEREDYKEAERHLERALALYQNAPKLDVEDVASAMNDLGEVYGLEGRFADGERLTLQSLKILEQRPGGGRGTNYAKQLNDLGNLYKDAGRLPEAVAAFERSLTAGRAALGDQHPNVAAAMGNLAVVMMAMSRNVEAENLYQRSLLIYEKAYGPAHPATAIGLGNLANLYNAIGRPVEALGLQERVLAIREKAFGPDSPDVARAMGNLANSYKALGRRDEAGALYARVLRIMSQKFGDNAVVTGTALSAVARWEQEDGRLDDAKQKFERVLKIDEQAFGTDHPELVDDLRSIAFIDIKTSRLPEARALLERALTIAQAKLGPRHRKSLATMVNLADVAGKQERWPDALGLLRRATEDNADRVATAVKSTTGPAERFSDLDNALINALWHVGDGKPDQAMTDEAFRAVQRTYQTQAGAALAQMAVRFGSGDDAIAKAVRRQQDLKASLDSLEQRTTTELGAADGKRNEALIASLRTEAVRAQAAYSETSAQIARDFPGYAELSSPAPVSVAQVQALLKPDEALVAYASTSEQSFVFAITREHADWQRIGLGSDAIADRVSKLREGLFNPDANATAPAPFDLGASHVLYRELLGPVENAIAGKPKLLIVPTGALTSLPFQVLLTKPADPAVALDERYRRAAWLVNDKAITVLPAVSSLRALRSFARASRATKPFIGFGNPQFQRSGGDGKRKVARSLQPYQSYYKGALVDYDMLRQSLPALPDTADELRAVASALGAPASDVRLGAAASVTNVMTASLNQYRVVDFATHGLVAGQVDGLSEPALVLSMPDRPTAEDDGLLTAGRVAKLNLDADWAVLSACNTAAGNTPGAEGLSGLARAFFYAGARSLLVSHWPLESDAAVKLTTAAFSEIARNPSIGRAEALRRSMRAFIADGPTRNADPSVWAPFVLVGEGN